jgi:error-prone DNA polymerase
MEKALHRTKGIPLFQEQLMELAIDVAGFTRADADQLRRAMGSKRGLESIAAMEQKLYDGMAANGITGELADMIYNRIEAFSSFGFAESHAISFALLVYASSWLKRHYPAAFCAALLNAQPMGFYSPQSLVQDARRHGIVVRPPSLGHSLAGASLEAGSGPPQCACGDSPAQPAVRMGLASVRTIGQDVAERIAAEREGRPYESMTDLSRRVGLTTEQLEALATAGALDGFGAGRREALWGAGAAAGSRPGQLDVDLSAGVPAGIPAMDGTEQLIADVWATGVTTTTYPTALIRPKLEALGIIPAVRLAGVDDRSRIWVGGVVTHRQRPSTAGGVTFLNLEDETGMVNVIVPETVWARHRRVARDAGGLMIRGILERTEDGVVNVLAEKIERLALGVRTSSRDFR